MKKNLGVIWFTGRNTVGIVAYENDSGEIKFVIGKGEGFDEETDKQLISDWGANITLDDVKQFFNRHDKNILDYENSHERLQKGRDYLMQIEFDKITVEDSLEAFGFGRDGLKVI